MLAQRIVVHPTDALRAVEREWHTRKRGCYVLEDKQGDFYIVAQKLASLVSFLNSIAVDAASRVSLSALHEALGVTGGRVDGWHKHRWRVRFAPLEDVEDLDFEILQD